MNKIFLIFIMIIQVYSCRPENDEVGELGLEGVDNSLILEKLIFPLDSESYFDNRTISFFNDNDKEFYTYFNNTNNSLYVFNVQNPSEFEKIEFEHEGPNGIGKNTKYIKVKFIDENNIILFDTNLSILYLADKNAKVLKKYQILEQDLKNSQLPYTNFSNIQSIEFLDNKLFMGTQLGRFIPEKFSEFPSFIAYDVESNKLDLLGGYPQIYDEVFWGSSFKYKSITALNKKQKVVVASYPIDDFLYVFDLKGKLITKKKAGSKFISTIKPFNNEKNIIYAQTREWERENQFSLSNSDYAGIIYDRYKNLYYRIVYLRPTEEKVASGTKVPDFSIITLDENLTMLSEKRFDSKVYSNHMIAVSKNGLAIARKDLYQKNEDEIVFDVFQLVQN